LTATAQNERPSPAELYRRAAALAPILASRAECCEQSRQCPPESIAEMTAAGLLQICRPARYGGYEYAWDVLSEVSRILARGCGSQAWVASVLNGDTQLVGAFSLEAQEEIWGQHPDTRIAGSVGPSGRATRVAGGARLSGRFGFASGIDHAEWLICGGLLEAEGGEKSNAPSLWCDFLVPKSAVTVIDDWEVAGLAGTGSKSFVIDDVLVPPHRFQDHVHSDDGTGPGTEIHRASVFRTPRTSVGVLVFTALALGVAEGFLASYLQHTRARNSRGLAVAEFGSTQLGLAKAVGHIEGAAAQLTAALRRWVDLMESGRSLSRPEKLTARLQGAFIARRCLATVQALFVSAGGHAIFHANPLQRQLRDLYAVCAHRGISLDEAATAYGKSALLDGRL
jgi:alkylation response protein AidB-like acyl-CoA dehydrogenase